MSSLPCDRRHANPYVPGNHGYGFVAGGGYEDCDCWSTYTAVTDNAPVTWTVMEDLLDVIFFVPACTRHWLKGQVDVSVAVCVR